MMDDDRGVALLLITGTMGAGKSTVMAEASDLLEREGIEHAAVDVDLLGLAYVASTPTNHDAMYANLECASAAPMRGSACSAFCLVRSVESPRGARAVPPCCFRGTGVVVCRLAASMPTLLARVTRRETGILQAEYVARVETLNAILDRAGLEDFTTVNENRSVTEVAHEMLVRAGWLAETPV
jgi:hypothetical protein